MHILPPKIINRTSIIQWRIIFETLSHLLLLPISLYYQADPLMHEIILVPLGQGGTQTSSAFWDLLSRTQYPIRWYDAEWHDHRQWQRLVFDVFCRDRHGHICTACTICGPWGYFWCQGRTGTYRWMSHSGQFISGKKMQKTITHEYFIDMLEVRRFISPSLRSGTFIRSRHDRTRSRYVVNPAPFSLIWRRIWQNRR